jgi:hypothetical protein
MLEAGVAYSDAGFGDCRWLTIATDENEGITIDFMHHARLFLIKQMTFISLIILAIDKIDF